jgi:cell surface protein SprA
VRTSLTAADVALGEAREVPLGDYARELTGQSLRREWVTQSIARINHVPTTADAQTKKGPLEFTLPVQMPNIATSILGKGAPSLNVSGSERISISGTSQWDNSTTSNGVKRSLFPSLDMRQDLNIALNGSLGDKVHVDVAQNSANTLPLANRIGLRYQGYDDEIVKNLDLGNTNLELPGTQYVSYSGRNEDLRRQDGGQVGGTDLRSSRRSRRVARRSRSRGR